MVHTQILIVLEILGLDRHLHAALRLPEVSVAVIDIDIIGGYNLDALHIHADRIGGNRGVLGRSPVTETVAPSRVSQSMVTRPEAKAVVGSRVSIIVKDRMTDNTRLLSFAISHSPFTSEIRKIEIWQPGCLARLFGPAVAP